jgi:YHS domain-containing protein
MNRLINPALVLALGVLGCSSPSSAPDAAAAQPAAQPQPATEPSPDAEPSTGALTLVEDSSMVCMINNQFMGKPQIPIEAEGITYYGCCEMCKTKLAEDPSSRTAIDPVSGATVNKAQAVLGKTATGEIHYFESKENLAKFAPG